MTVSQHRKITTTIASLTAVVLLFGVVDASAELIVYDGFNYGRSNSPMHGKSGGGEWGLTNSWIHSCSYAAGESTYMTNGLSFTNLLTSGGCAMLDVGGGRGGRIACGRQLAVTQTNTIWGSFVYSYANGSAAAGIVFSDIAPSVPVVPPNGSGSDYDLNLLVCVNIVGLGSTGDLRLDDEASDYPQWAGAVGGVWVGNDVTGLGLYKVEGLSTNAGTRTVTMWSLNAAQFSHFKPDGLTETELNAAALGFGDDQVLQRQVFSYSNSGAKFEDNDYLNLWGYVGPIERLYDEVRISNTSLDETVPLEPPAERAAVLIVR